MIVTPRVERANRRFAMVCAILTASGLACPSVLLAPVAPVGLLISGAIALGFLVHHLLRRKVRRRLWVMQQPFPEDWERILDTRVALFRALGTKEKERFRQLVTVFLDEARITGIRTDVDETTRVLVAASAVIPILGFPDWEYEDLSEVLIYPSSFGADFRTDGEDEERILGMVGGDALRGIMVLSKPDLLGGFSHPSDKRNVGIHEFAHLVDKADGAVNGIPAGIPGDVLEPWVKKIRESLEGNPEAHPDMNPYGYTSPVEFFAVASEYFFESPSVLKRRRPELYALLERIYRQDMKSRFRSAVKSVFQRRGRKLRRNAPCPCGSGKKYKKCCLTSRRNC